MRWSLLVLLASFVSLPGCSKKDPGGDSSATPFTFAEPTDMPPLRGPGGPSVAFTEPELWQNCAFLPGGPEDRDHHNEVAGYRGHLVMPWSPEWGGGGLSFFEMDDPCNPVKVSDAWTQRMRETHAIGFTHLRDGPHAGDWAFVTQVLGIMAWDVSDATAPVAGAELQLEGISYPDAYARVVFSVFLQYPWLYVAGSDNGIYVVDVSDPTDPQPAGRFEFEPNLRAGMVHVLGNKMLVVSAEQSDAALLDVSNPTEPQLYPGGRFTITDGTGTPREAYAGGMVGDMAIFARKDSGGGVIVFDVSDPTAPAFRTEHTIPDGNGGYVFWHEGVAFLGNSHRADVIDFTDLDNPVLLGSGDLEGDLDTITPFGNVAVLSVDDEAIDRQSSAVMPWRTEPDTRGPQILAVDPVDGAGGVATTARIGVGFDEHIDAATVFAGSIRLWDADGNAVDGWGSAQETLASFAPKEPLEPGTTYTVEVLADGIRDVTGNPVESTTSWTFTTGAR